MSSTLPERVDPWQLCANNRSFEGHISLDALNRLRPLLASTDGEAAFTLLFARDDDKRPIVKGSVDAVLQLVCQRCLEPVRLVISTTFALGLVESLDEASGLPDTLDPLWVDGGELILADIVEDELILAVPVTPRHVEAECSVSIDEFKLPEGVEPRRDNPFAVLKSLKLGKTDS